VLSYAYPPPELGRFVHVIHWQQSQQIYKTTKPTNRKRYATVRGLFIFLTTNKSKDRRKRK